MFHVAPLLPFQEDDKQRVERKRHLGNDVVLLIFLEGNQPLDPTIFKSHFNRKLQERQKERKKQKERNK